MDQDEFKLYKKVRPVYAKKMDTDFEIATIKGILKGKAGDYLCRTHLGDIYPCDKKVFEESYEEIKEDK